MNEPSDEDLLKDWETERGRFAKPLTMAERPQITRALRDWWRRRSNPKPLLFCEACGCNARGTYRQ